MVPVMIIVEGDKQQTVISEAAAIMLYLCELHGETDLYPDNHLRLQINKWMFWAAEHFRQASPMYFEEKVIAPLMGKQANVHRLKEADKLIETHATILNEHLKDRKFVVGDHVTLADFDLAAALSQMPRTKIPYERFSHIMAWKEYLENHIDAWRITGNNLNKRMNTALNIS